MYWTKHGLLSDQLCDEHSSRYWMKIINKLLIKQKHFNLNVSCIIGYVLKIHVIKCMHVSNGKFRSNKNMDPVRPVSDKKIRFFANSAVILHNYMTTTHF